MPIIMNIAQHDPVKHIDMLLQERRNSIANALELHLSCTNLWRYANHTETIMQIFATKQYLSTERKNT